MSALVLESDRLRATFDEATGTLTGLLCGQTGWNAIRRPGLGLSFELMVPVPGHRNNYVRGTSQTLENTEATAHEIRFTWRGLSSDHADDLDITVVGRATLTDVALEFSLWVDNRSEHTVEGFAYPCIGDLNPPTPGGRLEKITSLGMEVHREDLMPRFAGDRGYYGFHHPINRKATNIDSPFLLVGDDEQGLYVGFHDPTMPYLASWVFEAKPGYADANRRRLADTDELAGIPARVELSVRHLPYVQPGEQRQGAPVALSFYQGDLYRGFDRYREWRATWFQAPRRPAWIEDVHAWHQIQILAPEDQRNFRYTDLPERARECRQHGIEVIQLTGWAAGGQDRGNPSHDTEPALGTLEELKAAVAECQALGVKVVLFSKFTWWDTSHDDFATEGIQHVTRDGFGAPHRAESYAYFSWTSASGINNVPLVPTCTMSPAWRDLACRELEKVLDLGATGTLFDQAPIHGDARYCFDPDHDHHLPAFVYAGDLQLARAFGKLIAARDPGFALAGELCGDALMQHYHLSYQRFREGHVPAYRYIDPFAPMMMQADGFADRNQLNRCLEYRYVISYEPYNFKGRPGDAPQTMAYGAAVDAFRRRYREYVWDAEYRGPQDATVLRDGVVSRDFTLYLNRATGRRAVVVCNTGDEPFTTRVAVEGVASWQVATPEAPEPIDSIGAERVNPQGAAVFMER